MSLKFYKSQMEKYGESYASAFYLVASLILALSSAGLHKIYDSAVGIIFFLADITVIILQFLDKAPKIRSYILFGASVFGSFIFLLGGLFDDLYNSIGDFEMTGAIIRVIANFVVLVASVAGLLTLFPKIKTALPEQPGKIYMAGYALFAVFGVMQLVDKPSIMSAGYIFATILWLLAANAIRLKYDEGTKPTPRD